MENGWWRGSGGDGGGKGEEEAEVAEEGVRRRWWGVGRAWAPLKLLDVRLRWDHDRVRRDQAELMAGVPAEFEEDRNVHLHGRALGKVLGAEHVCIASRILLCLPRENVLAAVLALLRVNTFILGAVVEDESPRAALPQQVVLICKHIVWRCRSDHPSPRPAQPSSKHSGGQQSRVDSRAGRARPRGQ